MAEKSPFPEVPVKTIERIASKTGTTPTQVAAVIQGLLQEPPAFVQLAGRFGAVQVERAKGVTFIDENGREYEHDQQILRAVLPRAEVEAAIRKAERA